VNLIKRVFNGIGTPHPFIFNGYSMAIPGVFTFLILVLLAPQQFQDIPLLQRSLFALLTGLIVAGAIFLTVKTLQKLFPTFMDEDAWTVGKEGLLYLVGTLLVNLLIFAAISLFYSGADSLFQRFGRTTWYTLSISIFPITVLVLFEQYRHQKNQLVQARQLTQSLQAENDSLKTENRQPSAPFQPLQFKAENGSIELQLAPEEVLCLRSDGNYVEVFYLLEEVGSVQLIRNKLKHLAPILPPKYFFRCHNRFIINGTHLVKVEGNARNLELKLRGLELLIPVSRSKVKSFSRFLEQLA
jgi:hypothetical protein